MFLVDVMLYTGQHLFSEPIFTIDVATATAAEFCAKTMVESAMVIHLGTGQVLHTRENLAARFRSR